MDTFKRTQPDSKHIGMGWHCFCCKIQSPNSKAQAKNKARVRRFARRKMKQELQIKHF